MQSQLGILCEFGTLLIVVSRYCQRVYAKSARPFSARSQPYSRFFIILPLTPARASASDKQRQELALFISTLLGFVGVARFTAEPL